MQAPTSILLSAAVLYMAAPARCQEMPPPAPDTAVATARETYRLSVENARYGRIQVSIDGGEHFLLIGRVLKPATASAPTAGAAQPGSVLRSSTDGVALVLAAGQVVKLLPVSASVTRGAVTASAIVTDIRPRTSLFGDYCPPAGTTVMQQAAGGAWKALPSGYLPSDGDTLGLDVVLPDIREAGQRVPSAQDTASLARLADLRKRLVALSEQYTAQAIARARENKRTVLSGVITLRAKLPSGEPEPITAVTYSIDGDIVAAQTTFPSAYGWDTTRVPNGEHVVEIRALSKYATVITRVRALVVVNNP